MRLPRTPSLNRRRLAVAAATVLVVVATVIAVIAFFPGHARPLPRVELRWPGKAASVLGPLDPVPGWPNAPLLASGSSFTPGGTVHIAIAGAQVATLRADGGGRWRTVLRVPRALAAGYRSVMATDVESGRQAPLAGLVVVRGPATVLWAGPTPLHAPHAMLVLGAGLARNAPVTLSVDPTGKHPVALGRSRTRASGNLAVVVGLPGGVAPGPHKVAAADADGRTAQAAIVVR